MALLASMASLAYRIISYNYFPLAFKRSQQIVIIYPLCVIRKCPAWNLSPLTENVRRWYLFYAHFIKCFCEMRFHTTMALKWCTQTKATCAFPPFRPKPIPRKWKERPSTVCAAAPVKAPRTIRIHFHPLAKQTIICLLSDNPWPNHRPHTGIINLRHSTHSTH